MGKALDYSGFSAFVNPADKSALECAPGCYRRGPCPLKIEAAQPTGYVDHLPNEIQARLVQRFQGVGGQPTRVDAATGHLRLTEPFCTIWRDLPIFEGR